MSDIWEHTTKEGYEGKLWKLSDGTYCLGLWDLSEAVHVDMDRKNLKDLRDAIDLELERTRGL